MEIVSDGSLSRPVGTVDYPELGIYKWPGDFSTTLACPWPEDLEVAEFDHIALIGQCPIVRFYGTISGGHRSFMFPISAGYRQLLLYDQWMI